jgi:hypothetical protein
VGENLSVGDIQLDKSKYTILTDAELAVAMVAAPTVEEAKPADAEGAAEPEVIKEKKPEAGEAKDAKDAKEKPKAKAK